jgi:hypothetical protein
MNCKTCGKAETKEIATRTIGRGANGVTRCHRLECGHAWHMAPSADGEQNDGIGPTPCSCGEIVTVNALLVAGRRLALVKDELADEEAIRAWSKHVQDALDGIPAESGAPSLARSAATVAKSAASGLSKKVGDLNNLLVRAIVAVS